MNKKKITRILISLFVACGLFFLSPAEYKDLIIQIISSLFIH